VCPIPLTVAIMTEVFYFSPISLSIIYLNYQLRMISATTRTKCPLLFFPQPQTSQHRNQKMAPTTHHKIVRILAATDHLSAAEKIIFVRLLKNAPASAEAATRRQADAS
jgi:hypothetical protein